jgi:PTS system mannose-specific IIA component
MNESDPVSEPLVGLVVVTHGSSAECLLGAAAGLVGELPATASVTVALEDAFDEVVSRVEKACEEVDAGVGILILVDLHGSSPFQACLSMLDGTRPAEIVCGLNLPMLLKLATVDRRELRPAELATVLKDVGRRSIRLGSELTGKVALAEPETGTR